MVTMITAKMPKAMIEQPMMVFKREKFVDREYERRNWRGGMGKLSGQRSGMVFESYECLTGSWTLRVKYGYEKLLSTCI